MGLISAEVAVNLPDISVHVSGAPVASYAPAISMVRATRNIM